MKAIYQLLLDRVIDGAELCRTPRRFLCWAVASSGLLLYYRVFLTMMSGHILTTSAATHGFLPTWMMGGHAADGEVDQRFGPSKDPFNQ